MFLRFRGLRLFPVNLAGKNQSENPPEKFPGLKALNG
jgi:hypothetical protein